MLLFLKFKFDSGLSQVFFNVQDLDTVKVKIHMYVAPHTANNTSVYCTFVCRERKWVKHSKETDILSNLS